jgi:signal transduction histidine kinase/CheY-like chemotaxis protein
MLFEDGRPDDFVYLDVNRAFESLTGLANVVGRRASEVIPGIRERDATLLELYGRVALTGKPETFERYVEALGMWFSIAAYCPAPGHFVAIFDVITERKRAEARAESAARFPAENPSPVLRVGSDGIVLYANAGARSLLHAWDCDVGQPVPADWIQHVAEVVAGNARREVEVVLGEKTFALVLAPIVEADHVNIYGHDITDRKRADESLKRAMADLERSNRDLEQFAYVASHDLQEPLRMVASYTQLLAQRYQGQLDEKAKKYIDYAVDGALRMQRLITDLLTYSRECAASMAFNEIKYRANLVKDFGQVPAVLGSEGKLSQVFLNLLINAAHAIPDGNAERNRIEIRTWADDEHVFAEVKDTGKGIPSENLRRIFEPFFTTKAAGIGSGLGLAICKDILTEIGGDIQVESEVGRGTRFIVRLPVPRELPEARRAEAGIETPRACAVRGRILVVDDEEPIRGMLQRMLRGHDVTTAASGEDARAILEKDPSFDLIVCDLMMSTMSGTDLHEWLVAHHPRLARQVVFLSGGAFTPKASAYLTSVGNIKLEKPVDKAELIRVANERIVAHRNQA